MTNQPFSPGLAGVIAGETQVSAVNQDSLIYRGYAIEDLARETCFEEVAHLLIYDDLPTRRQLSLLRDTFMEYRRLPMPVLDTLRAIPTDAPMMDVLRTTVSMLGHFAPGGDNDLDDLRRRSIWLTATIASLITARYRFVKHEPLIEPKPGLSHAVQILYQCHGEEPDPQAERLIDLTLILYAEHEFNASTFTDRVIASTRSDMVSAVVGAIGALKGPLHGGANERAMAMLEQFHSAAEAESFIQRVFETKEKVMGFGHRAYKNGDHRARILEAELRKLAAERQQEKWMAIYDAIKQPMIEKKGIYPNVDYPCGLTYYLLGLPIDMYTPLFVASRITGWCAHFIEQRLDDTLYRPLSAYTGEPPRPVPSINQR